METMIRISKLLGCLDTRGSERELFVGKLGTKQAALLVAHLVAHLVARQIARIALLLGEFKL